MKNLWRQPFIVKMSSKSEIWISVIFFNFYERNLSKIQLIRKWKWENERRGTHFAKFLNSKFLKGLTYSSVDVDDCGFWDRWYIWSEWCSDKKTKRQIYSLTMSGQSCDVRCGVCCIVDVTEHHCLITFFSSNLPFMASTIIKWISCLFTRISIWHGL